MPDRQFFNNIVVSDLPRSKAFYEALGFSFNAQFSNDDAACLVISPTVFVMLHTPSSMQRFSQLPPADPRQNVCTLYGFSVPTKEDVDATVAKALAAGAEKVGERQDYGFMIQDSFRDPDGHHWEVLWMDEANVQ